MGSFLGWFLLLLSLPWPQYKDIVTTYILRKY